MPYVRCPSCQNSYVSVPNYYDDTVQCSACATILRVLMRNGIAVNVRTKKIDINIPSGLPEDLRHIFADAVTCLENNCYAASLVMARVLAEGLLTEAGFTGTLMQQIKGAYDKRAITDYAYHLASASRLMGNFGAHYSSSLTNLDPAECKTVLDVVRSLAANLLSASLLK